MSLFTEKTVMVTGALSPVGREVSARIASEGAHVIAADAAASGLDLEAGAIAPCHVDAGDPASVQKLVSAAVDRFGRIDCLVQASTTPFRSSFLEMGVATFDDAIETNLRQVFIVGQAVARVMRDAGSGSIVNIASLSGVVPNLDHSAYSAAMGGVIHLSKIMAVDLAQYGIRVNAVAPGPVETTALEASLKLEERDAWQRRISLGRLARPSEVAASVAFLCSTTASYMTGQVLAVDGGFASGGMAFVTARGANATDPDASASTF